MYFFFINVVVGLVRWKRDFYIRDLFFFFIWYCYLIFSFLNVCEIVTKVELLFD